jgi:hypothetical protein
MPAPARTRTFGGQTLRFYVAPKNKTIADRVKLECEEDGWKARIIPHEDIYAIYRRRK